MNTSSNKVRRKRLIKVLLKELFTQYIEFSTMPRIYLNSFPKGGTLLTTKLLSLLNFRPTFIINSNWFIGRDGIIYRLTRGARKYNDYVMIGIDLPIPLRASWLEHKLSVIPAGYLVSGHIGYSDHIAHIFHSNGFKFIQVIRDPRDIAVSHAHYWSETPSHFGYKHYQRIAGWDERLSFSISGGPIEGLGYLESIRTRARSVEGWMCRKDVLTIRFEDLVGAKGGGSADRQINTITKMCEFLNIEVKQDQIKNIQETLFGGTPTFRKGQVGGWINEFSDENLRLFDEVTGTLLYDWGYIDR